LNEILSFVVEYRLKFMRTLSVLSFYFLVRQNLMPNPESGTYYSYAFSICLLMAAVINALYFIAMKRKVETIVLSAISIILVVALFISSQGAQVPI